MIGQQKVIAGADKLANGNTIRMALSYHQRDNRDPGMSLPRRHLRGQLAGCTLQTCLQASSCQEGALLHIRALHWSTQVTCIISETLAQSRDQSTCG